MASDRIPDALREACRTTAVFDTHEHILPRARLTDGLVGLEDLILHSYIQWTLPADVGKTRAALLEALPAVRTRSFYRHWRRAMQQLYRFKGEIDGDNWDEISARVRARYDRPDWTRRVLTEHARVAMAILDQYWDHLGGEFDPGIFAPALRINPLVFGFHPLSRDHNGASAHGLAARVGVKLATFDDFEHFCRRLVGQCHERGVVCLKSALAYDRPLSFAPVRRDAAARVWGKEPRQATEEEATAFGDYVVHLLARLAGQEGLPFQWHTGLGRLGGSQPSRLAPLIERHRDTTFVLLHGGYPWTSEWLAMAFSHPNVRLDLTWLPNISPVAAVRTIEEAVDVVNPAALCGGGGDAWTAEEAYGALLALRESLEEALGRLAARGRLGLDEACRLARDVLHDNAASLYGMRVIR